MRKFPSKGADAVAMAAAARVKQTLQENRRTESHYRLRKGYPRYQPEARTSNMHHRHVSILASALAGCRLPALLPTPLHMPALRAMMHVQEL
jgi:hypothetical protein